MDEIDINAIKRKIYRQAFDAKESVMQQVAYKCLGRKIETVVDKERFALMTFALCKDYDLFCFDNKVIGAIMYEVKDNNLTYWFNPEILNFQ